VWKQFLTESSSFTAEFFNFAPELTGIGKYSGEMAEWLAGQFLDVIRESE